MHIRNKVIIILTIIFVSLAIGKWFTDADYFDNGTVIEREYDRCDLLYLNDSGKHNICYAAAQREYSKLPNRINEDILLVIAIPILAFVCVKFCNYLFPTKNREKE
jgi:hypothetical protein